MEKNKYDTHLVELADILKNCYERDDSDLVKDEDLYKFLQYLEKNSLKDTDIVIMINVIAEINAIVLRVNEIVETFSMIDNYGIADTKNFIIRSLNRVYRFLDVINITVNSFVHECSNKWCEDYSKVLIATYRSMYGKIDHNCHLTKLYKIVNIPNSEADVIVQCFDYIVNNRISENDIRRIVNLAKSKYGDDSRIYDILYNRF